MIDPNEITTARVGELTPSPFELSDNIPHETGETLLRGTVQQLADTIGDYLGVVSGSSYNNTVVPDGGTLPDTTTKEWLFVGKGTFHNVGGQPDIITTEELNILSSNGTYWSLAVEIPIDVELAGITQNIRSGYTQTVPSEDAVFKRFAEIITIINSLTSSNILNESLASGTTVTDALNNLNSFSGGLAFIDYPRLEEATNEFIIPTGKTAKFAVVNYGANYFPETVNNYGELNTFIQADDSVSFGETLAVGNYVVIFYQ